MAVMKIAGEQGKQYISNITVPTTTYPSGENFEIKDELAWNKINELVDSIGKVMNFRAIFPDNDGSMQAKYYDGSTLAEYPYGDDLHHAAEPGDVIIVKNSELIWGGDKWSEFGSTGSLRALAFSDTVLSEKFTPNGGVYDRTSQRIESGKPVYDFPDFRGIAENISTRVRPPVSGNKWQVSVPDYGKGNISFSGSIQPSGDVDINVNSQGSGSQGRYTPSGTISYPTGTTLTASQTQTWEVKNYVDAGYLSDNAKYTPQGEIRNLTTNIVPSVTKIPRTVVGEEPSWSATVQDENLTIEWRAGQMTKFQTDDDIEDDDKTIYDSVITGFQEISTSGEFVGSPVYLSASGRPYVDPVSPTFTGNSVYLNGSVSGDSAPIEVTVTGSITSDKTMTYDVVSNGDTSFASDQYTPHGSIYKNSDNKGLIFVGEETQVYSNPV